MVDIFKYLPLFFEIGLKCKIEYIIIKENHYILTYSVSLIKGGKILKDKQKKVKIKMVKIKMVKVVSEKKVITGKVVYL